MIQDMKQMIRFITFIFALVIGISNVWAADIQEGNIFINVLPNSSAGTVTKSVSGRTVTITATPATGYSIDAAHIIAEKMVNPSAAPRRAPGLSPSLPISGTNPFTFTIPEGYDGAYVIVNFYITSEGYTTITSLSQISITTGKYELTSDIDASSLDASLSEFKGTLDGKNHTIYNLQHPLFSSTDGAIIRNLNFEGVNITSGDTNGDAGVITSKAKGATRIYNCGILPSYTNYDTDGNVTGFTGSSIGGSGNVGGLVGKLEGTARVINCFSYATITSGTTVGGIVGNNTVTTTAASAANLKTMVMNCMFYGNIAGGTSKAPIYNGTKITNVGENTGVSNFNYFWEGASYVQNKSINEYNCALSAETRYLQRFEFYRHLLNSNRELAAWWVEGQKSDMAKWVLDKSIAPYPILKEQGYYPSVVNHISAKRSPSDNSSVVDYTSSTAPETPETQKKLTVNISGTGITTSSLTLPITDKDPNNYNFNYHTVQLPYFNDVGTGNYQNGQVVTGWEVTVSGGTNSYTPGAEGSATVNETTGKITLSTPYNFADRNSTGKDDFNTSGRIFSQGAYFDVPDGVSSIDIKPHWGKAVFIADASFDVVYDKDMTTAYNVPNVGGDGVRYTNGTSYPFTTKDGNISLPVYTKLDGDDGALAALSPSGSVYDNALVLVGNFHSLALSSEASGPHYTIMSADFNHDNEPDYSYILRFNDRKRVHPVRLDFLDAIGLGMAQKSTGGKGTYNFGIMQPLGWFECTNTGLFRVTQFEYDRTGRANSPMILQGGVIEQWVTVAEKGTTVVEAESVTYYHVGGNVWFKEFHIGVHQDKTDNKFVSPHPPISVTGGDFDEFYLTGLYNTPNANYPDNAECYINGGRFGKVAGTGMQGLGNAGGAGVTEGPEETGNIIWQIDNADIDEFYAGGINAAHKAEGNIWTVIKNSRVDQFCGGPKFGDMNSDKKVVTNAENCTFRTFFGAGYGGNSYNRRYPDNYYTKYNYEWNTWLTGAASYDYSYDSKYNGVETRIDYQFIPKSDNNLNVARLFIDYVSFSLATTYDVTSILDGCTITTSKLGRLDLFEQCIGNFYGGGSLGKVNGPVKSTLTNCTVEGNVFGAGYSATLPKVNVMVNRFQREPSYDENTGAYTKAILPATTEYTWDYVGTGNTVNASNAIDKTNHKLRTDVNLSESNLGSVSGAVTLNITTSGSGKTKIGTDGDTTKGNVYGGGDASYVNNETTPTNASTTVNISGNTTINGDVFGGGNEGLVSGSTKVNIMYTE